MDYGRFNAAALAVAVATSWHIIIIYAGTVPFIVKFSGFGH
jgi:hypothetical protein